ncbi:MAG: DUF3955 domain-containing protein [Sulfitobacter sp.]
MTVQKYRLPLIFLAGFLICGLAYKLIGSEVAPDGTLVEPFFLIPLAWLSLLLAVITFLLRIMRR